MGEFWGEQFTFRGRMARWPFFWRQFLWCLALLAVMLVITVVFPAGMTVVAIILAVLCLAIALASLYVRRLHDLDMSGWWYVALLLFAGLIGAVQNATGSPGATFILGIIGLLPYLYLLFARGTDGPNRYDPTLSGPVFGRTRG